MLISFEEINKILLSKNINIFGAFACWCAHFTIN